MTRAVSGRVGAACVAVASGVLWGLAFGRRPWLLAPFAALAPLVLLLGARRAPALGFLFGVATWATGLSWIPATLGQFGGLPRAVAVGCLLLLAAYLGLYHLAFAAFGRGLWRAGGAWALLGLPALWVALEWARTHALAGFGFPWNLAAYAVIAVPGALPLSAWVGAYGVSFAVVFANVGVALGVARRRVAPAALGLLLPLLVFVLAGRASDRRAEHDRARHFAHGDFGRPVRIVQPNIPIRAEPSASEVLADYRRALDLATENCEPGALVVLPESAFWPFSYERDPAMKADLDALGARGCAIVFNGEKGAPAGGVYNSAFLVGRGGVLGRYDKRHLVPFGEYVPLASVLGWVGQLARGIGQFTPGAAPSLLPWGDDRLGAPICFEAVYPEEVAELVRAGATILVTVTNDAWYGDTAAPEQHLRAARFRAAENRRTLLRAGLTGISAVIAADGAERERIPLLSTGVIRGRVWGRNERTPYSRAPSVPPLVCAFGAGFAIIARRFRGGPPA